MSRISVVAMLVAAEVLIVGMAIYAVGGSGASFASGMHHVDFTAATVAPLAVGATPHVVIDDPSSRVAVAVSNDGLVHVRDLTEMRGAVFSNAGYPQLRVSRTLDGVSIARNAGDRISVDIFGFSRQAIEVEVPSASRVEIARCGGADLSGLSGGVSVHSVDGHVTVADIQGPVDVRSDDGYIAATNVHGGSLALESMDGHLALENIDVSSLTADTRDGHIEARGVNVAGDATLQTGDGPIQLRLAPNANVTINASTRDGRITVDGSSLDRDDSAQRTIRLGAGSSSMKLDTADGSIHIFTNGAFQSDGL
jgi:hypothetical protein